MMPIRSLMKRGCLTGAIATVVLAGTAGAVELNPAALIYKLPDQIQWRDPLGTSGVNQAVLQGDPTKPGLCVVINRVKAGKFRRPHFAHDDGFIPLVKGPWRV